MKFTVAPYLTPPCSSIHARPFRILIDSPQTLDSTKFLRPLPLYRGHSSALLNLHPRPLNPPLNP
jgi:hypothetical protein